MNAAPPGIPQATLPREIPFNHTSLSDPEIIAALLGEETARLMAALKDDPNAKRTVRMLYEILGDIWVVRHNPYLIDDMLASGKRLQQMIFSLRHRLGEVEKLGPDRDSHPQDPADPLLESVRAAIDRFFGDLREEAELRSLALARLTKATARDNIEFHGFSRASHQTDATDWRMFPPFVVVTPQSETEVQAVVRECEALGLSISARGGGTGLAGGCIAIRRRTAIVSDERMARVSEPEPMQVAGHTVMAVRADSGATVEAIRRKAAEKGFFLASRPQSAPAAHIGSAVALNTCGNASGRWGTTAENLLAWTLVGAEGDRITVARTDGVGPIPQGGRARFLVARHAHGGNLSRQEICVPGAALRLADGSPHASDKHLASLPGLQKEGSDGVITSVTLLLRPIPAFAQPLCVEVRSRLSQATDVALEIVRRVPGKTRESVVVLDATHMKAAGWRRKTAGTGNPVACVLVRLSGDDPLAIRAASATIRGIAKERSSAFWEPASPSDAAECEDALDAESTIAAATNAFALRHDLVVPSGAIPQWIAACELSNTFEALESCLMVAAALEERLLGCGLAQPTLARCRTVVGQFRRRWALLRNTLAEPLESASLGLGASGIPIPDVPRGTVLDALLARTLQPEKTEALLDALKAELEGKENARIRSLLEGAAAKSAAGQVRIAVSILADTGCVRLAIPVNSDNIRMLRRAESACDSLVRLALRLGGAPTAGRGLGLLNRGYARPENLEAARSALKASDRQATFGAAMRSGTSFPTLHTSSFGMLSREAETMQLKGLRSVLDAIRSCVHCGRCAAVCPMRPLARTPHEKTMALPPIADAILYEVQTRRGPSVRHYRALEEVADHCTLCSRCAEVCPVGIDFSDVTKKLRALLADEKRLACPLPERLELLRLIGKGSFPASLGKAAFQGMYGAARVLRPLARRSAVRNPRNTDRRPNAWQYAAELSLLPMLWPSPPKTLRAILGFDSPGHIPVIHPNAPGSERPPLLFFPGCSGERTNPRFALAVLALLWANGVPAVLPPKDLCCGAPHLAHGWTRTAQETMRANRILLHRMANTLNYLDIRTVLVPCRECLRSLSGYGLEEIFPECRIIGLRECLSEMKIRVQADDGQRFVCRERGRTAFPHPIEEILVPPAGAVHEHTPAFSATRQFSLHRPDIARRVEALETQLLSEAQRRARSAGFSGPVTVLEDDPRTTDRRFVALPEELAVRMIGPDWMQDYLDSVRSGGAELVLL